VGCALEVEFLTLEELKAQRADMRESLRSELFDKQLALRDDPAQFKAAHPGRRAGKSEFIPRSALLDALDAGFEEYVVIGAETQKKAKALHWHKLERAAKRAGIPLVSNKTDGTFRTPWGAVILFWGISDEGAVDLLRGFAVAAAYFDEVATYASLLKYLCNDVMHPMLATTGGKLTLCGTPSLTRAGHWFEICKGTEKHNWSVHHWDMLQNKCFPRDAEEELAKAAARLGGIESATYQREWLGLFVNDPGMQVYQYVAGRNDLLAEAPPLYNRATWTHTIAVDFGTTSACAWSVLCSAPHSNTVYVLCSMKQVGLLTDQAAKVTADLCHTYRPDMLVGDAGGLGAPYVKEWNQRYVGMTKAGERPKPGEYGMPIMLAAEKTEKRAGIEFVNTELFAARIILCQPACAPLSEEAVSLPWRDEYRLEEKKGMQNHCCDTLLYGEKAHMAYLNEALPPKANTTRQTPDDPAYVERERAALRASEAGDWWNR
jgi:hypothetical protein